MQISSILSCNSLLIIELTSYYILIYQDIILRFKRIIPKILELDTGPVNSIYMYKITLLYIKIKLDQHSSYFIWNEWPEALQGSGGIFQALFLYNRTDVVTEVHDGTKHPDHIFLDDIQLFLVIVFHPLHHCCIPV